jgi:hypothetical protein
LLRSAGVFPALRPFTGEPWHAWNVGFESSVAEASMSERNPSPTTCLAGVAAAILLLVMPVEAQVPDTTPSTAPVVKPQETVNLTMEQKHLIKEIIIKDMKTEPQDQAAKVPTTVGEVVPAGIPLQPIPVEVSAKIPQIKTHSFVVKDGKVVIIDTKDNKVAALVE